MTEHALDPEQFVGTPPAGDATPEDFSSNDQSADPTESEPEPASEEESR
jgi:hypothetical protein